MFCNVLSSRNRAVNRSSPPPLAGIGKGSSRPCFIWPQFRWHLSGPGLPMVCMCSSLSCGWFQTAASSACWRSNGKCKMQNETFPAHFAQDLNRVPFCAKMNRSPMLSLLSTTVHAMNLSRRPAIHSLCLSSLGILLLPAAAPAMDHVRVETHVDAAIAKYGVSGSNVLVAIFDRGVDWKNNDFRKADGTTRLEAIFDLTDDSGASDPGNSYSMGTLYSQARINAALAAGTNLVTRDAVGHGTTTAGIPTGGGRNNPLYRGVAPAARILCVKITSDGAPAHDGEPAEAPFYDSARIPVAIDFARDTATALGLPCVMLLNLGSVGGPTDGTSSLCQKIDATVGPGILGRAFVTGASDDGSAPNRAGGTVTQGQALNLQIDKVDNNTLDFDLWYPETDRFSVNITTPIGTFGPYASPPTDVDSDVQSQADFLDYQLGAGVDFYSASSPKREIWVRFTGPAGAYTVRLAGDTVVSGRFDATLNPSRFD